MEVCVFARLHARPGSLRHPVRFVEGVGPLLDHPFAISLAEQIW